MGIDSYITDPQNHRNVHVVHINNAINPNDYTNKNALVVATHPLKAFENQGKIFTSSVHGIDMNIGITLSTLENIHNGLDDVYWTASSISGVRFFFNSGDQAHTGAASIKTDNAAVNDAMQFLAPNDVDLSDSVILSLWVYVDKDWISGDSIRIFGWDSGTGTMVGIPVFLEDYFSFSIFGVWQNISISLTDMELRNKTIDAFRIGIVAASGKSPKFYLDDITLEGTVGDVEIGEFFVEPDKESWYHVSSLRFIIAAPITGKVENGTMPGLAYNKILGIGPLSTGIIYQRLRFGNVESSFTARQLSDLLSSPGTIFQTVSDGTNTMITIDQPFEIPVVLRSENQDELKITIIDNLSGLSLFRVFVNGHKEAR